MRKPKSSPRKAQENALSRILKWYYRQVYDGSRIFLKLIAFYSSILILFFVIGIILGVLAL